ncbi:hypothetical protein MP228_007459 [Amoeboaphelidium protococcarum]|nr:hypothetical protein MP228_007459 [Amoeboaphelidium protococcarum]
MPRKSNKPEKSSVRDQMDVDGDAVTSEAAYESGDEQTSGFDLKDSIQLLGEKRTQIRVEALKSIIKHLPSIYSDGAIDGTQCSDLWHSLIRIVKNSQDSNEITLACKMLGRSQFLLYDNDVTDSSEVVKDSVKALQKHFQPSPGIKDSNLDVNVIYALTSIVVAAVVCKNDLLDVEELYGRLLDLGVNSAQYQASALLCEGYILAALPHLIADYWQKMSESAPRSPQAGSIRIDSLEQVLDYYLDCLGSDKLDVKSRAAENYLILLETKSYFSDNSFEDVDQLLARYENQFSSQLQNLSSGMQDQAGQFKSVKKIHKKERKEQKKLFREYSNALDGELLHADAYQSDGDESAVSQSGQDSRHQVKRKVEFLRLALGDFYDTLIQNSDDNLHTILYDSVHNGRTSYVAQSQQESALEPVQQQSKKAVRQMKKLANDERKIDKRQKSRDQLAARNQKRLHKDSALSADLD